ncbi:hypothetical protein [uncultured Pontibacter sp.]|uniref:hypothetical protein n=1 Tax=uncultured Pontibacter sp. TaxID=453356 RepID=UPI002613164A|nr:hypothetical protein [uncultured Pontibacter sp.]
MSLTAQSQDIKFINLVYSTAAKPVNAEVKVIIHPNSDNTYRLKVESVSLRQIDPAKSIDKEIIITAGQFSELVNAIQGIKQAEIIGGPHPTVLDGEACSIIFGTLGSSISYQVNTPNHDTDRRKLNDFLKAYELILSTAKLDPKLILG